MSAISTSVASNTWAPHNYFKDRTEAGELLAKRLEKYRYEDTIVLALSEGAVPVAAVIASRLHSLIAMLLTKDIYLPDGRTVVGVIDEVGGFIYNNAFSTGEIEELESEYRSNIEFAKTTAMHEIHMALGQGGVISTNYFRNRVVIVVSDGSLNGMAFDMADNYLRGVHTKKIIMASVVASVLAIDKMHLLADDLECLNVTGAGFEVDHYFDNNDIPNKHEIINILNNIILQWHRPEFNYENSKE